MPEMSSRSSLAAPVSLDFRDLWIYNAFFTILSRKNCVLLNSVQEFIEIEASLLLTFFIRLHVFFYKQHFCKQRQAQIGKKISKC